MDAIESLLATELRRRYPAWGALHGIASVGGGLSGASLFHVRSDEGDFAVKLTLASNLRLDVVRSRHDLIRAIDADRQDAIFPRLTPDREGRTAWIATLQDETVVGEARQWLRFDDLHAAQRHGGAARVCAAFELTGRFHARSAAIRLSPSATALLASPTPFPGRYLDDLSRVGPTRIESVRRALSTAAPETQDLGASYLSRLPAVVERTREMLAALPGMQSPVRPCLRDVHRRNIAFRGDAAAAFLDWDALRFDRRVVDFARLAASFGMSPVDAKEVTRDACRRMGEGEEFSDWESAALAPALMTQVWLPPLNWLEWLLVEKRAFADAEAARRRMTETLLLATGEGAGGIEA